MAKGTRPRHIWLPAARQAIQFKVTLKYTEPPIWRRFVVPDNFTLGELHEVIQETMGWDNSHLYAFQINRVVYAGWPPDDDEDMGKKDAALTMLGLVVSKAKQKFSYEYDFGDSWQHEVVVEKLLPLDPQVSYPVCLDGARACPPEDCGSYPGYEGILAALAARRKTADQKELLEWLGSGYDPERFDLAKVNQRLARIGK